MSGKMVAWTLWRTVTLIQCVPSAKRVFYEGPELRLVQRDVELPDRERIWWDVVYLFRSASVVLLDESESRVLLVRRHRFVQRR
jgi:hypothetical protein